MNWHNMTLMEYIKSENRRFFLTDLGTNGLKFVDKKVYDVYNSPETQLKMAEGWTRSFREILSIL